ncbi:MAG: hypothetical protein IPO86_16340 [Saprospiraceae bacterium]|nr:hypothetical protein [Saprospiraceae bacterium]
MLNKLASNANYSVDGNILYPIRNFANIPLLVFIYLVSEQLIRREADLFSNSFNLGNAFLLFIFLLISLYIGHATRGDIKQTIYKIRAFRKTGILGHVIIIFIAAIFWKIGSYFQFISIVFMFLLFLWNNCYHYAIERVKEALEDIDKIQDYNDSDIKYKFFLIILIFLLIAFALSTKLDKLNHISPLIILNVCFSFYIALVDLLFNTPSEIFEIQAKNEKETENPNTREQSAWAVIFRFLKVVALFFAIYLIFVDSLSSHRIRKERISAQEFRDFGNRENLIKYYYDWKSVNICDDAIYLIAAQGGGSKAGAWVGMNLDYMFQSDTCLLRKIFAISTVSGGTSGINMLLTKWYLNDYKIVPREGINMDIYSSIYGFNYLSSSLWGLLISDGIRIFLDKKRDYDRDRNYYHQLEELVAIKKCYHDSSSNQLDTLLNGDFMLKWNDPNYKYRTPLHFINTATTQAGKRAIVSPVIVDSSIFNTSIDFYDKFRSKNCNQCNYFSLPMVTAVKLSQSFPFSSSYNYVDGVGNMIDGGLYENSGCNTIYEIYTALKNCDKYQKFVIFSIQCSDNDNCNTDPVNSVFVNTISSAASTPFSGHSHYWEQKLKLEVDRNNDSFRLIYPVKNGVFVDVPLGIALSKSSIDTLKKYVKQ